LANVVAVGDVSAVGEVPVLLAFSYACVSNPSKPARAAAGGGWRGTDDEPEPPALDLGGTDAGALFANGSETSPKGSETSPPDAAAVNGSSPGGRAPAAGNCTDKFPGLVE
jgi:hypothetical protein